MQEIRNWLANYGLNDTEIAVYLCIVEHPHLKTADIQKYTALVRTTIYYSLAELKSKGLITENYQNNIKTYQANNPLVLATSIESSIAQQTAMLDELQNVKTFFASVANDSSTTNNAHTARYEGETAIKQAIELAFRCDSKRWHVIASYDNFLRHTNRKFQQYYLSERERRGIKAKTLWEPRETWKDPALKDIFFRNPRVLPEEFRGNFDSLVILYDDVTLIVQPHEQMTAHAIHDASSTHLMRLLFMSIWNNAKPVRSNQESV